MGRVWGPGAGLGLRHPPRPRLQCDPYCMLGILPGLRRRAGAQPKHKEQRFSRVGSKRGGPLPAKCIQVHRGQEQHPELRVEGALPLVRPLVSLGGRVARWGLQVPAGSWGSCSVGGLSACPWEPKAGPVPTFSRAGSRGSEIVPAPALSRASPGPSFLFSLQ